MRQSFFGLTLLQGVVCYLELGVAFALFRPPPSHIPGSSSNSSGFNTTSFDNASSLHHNHKSGHYRTTGLDNQNYDAENWIKAICNSEPFRVTFGNIVDSNVSPNYTEYSTKRLGLYMMDHQGEPITEISFIGHEILGVENLKCSYETGRCTPEITCEDIAAYRGI